MAFQALGVPFKLTPQDMGQGDWLSSLGQGMQLGQNYQLFPQQLQQAKLQNMISQAQAQYAQPMAQQNLQKALLENKYFGPRSQADINLENAQSKQAQATANKLLAMQDLVKNLLGKNSGTVNPNSSSPMTSSGNSMADNQSSGNFGAIPNSQPAAINSSPTTAVNNVPSAQPNLASLGQTSSLTLPQADMLGKYLGLPESKIIDVNGTKLAVTPFGNIPVAQGLTPSQEAYQKGLGKYSSTMYGNLVDSYNAQQNQGSAIDQLIYLAKSDPDFRNVSGPIKSFFAKWNGNPAQKALLGNLMSSSGEIALQIAPSIKGTFTGRDQTLINSIKANPNDFPDVFLGKLQAQKLIQTVLSERTSRAANYINNGMSPLESIKKATQETPLDGYRDKVNQLINPPKVQNVTYANGREFHKINGKWLPVEGQ